jgi:hypothetical protein
MERPRSAVYHSGQDVGTSRAWGNVKDEHLTFKEDPQGPQPRTPTSQERGAVIVTFGLSLLEAPSSSSGCIVIVLPAYQEQLSNSVPTEES